MARRFSPHRPIFDPEIERGTIRTGSQVGVIPFSVTINKGATQADPTEHRPIVFDVVFSEPVSGFATGDVTLSGTAGATTQTVTNSGDDMNFTVTVTGMTNPGTVVADIAGSVCVSQVDGDPNPASTSTDNSVLYECQQTDPFDDDFNRADATNIGANGIDNLGACWSQATSGPSGGTNYWTITSNRMRVSVGGLGGSSSQSRFAEALHTVGSDFTIEFDQIDMQSSFTSTAVYFRCNSAFTAGYRFDMTLSGFGGPDLLIALAGIGGGGSTSTTIIGGGSIFPVRWIVEAIGSSLAVKSQPVGGGSITTRLTLTDSTHTGTHIGWLRTGGGGGDTAQNIDNVEIF